MPAARPLLKRLSVFAAKVESVPGTAETLAAADGKYDVWNFDMKEETEFNTRPGQSVFSPLTGVPGPQGGRATFELWMTGAFGISGDAWATVLLPACGFKNTSNTYTPESGPSAPVALTIGHYEDGRHRRLRGCNGKVKFILESGKPALAQFDFMGGYVAPSDVAKIAPDYPRIVPPRFVNATFTVGGTNFTITKLEIDVDNTIVLRPDATSPSGILGAVITNRQIKVTIDPEAVLYATKNWNTDWTAGTEAALNCVLGGTATNIITITAPKLQLMAPPNPADRNDLVTDNLVFSANRSVDAGDDEVSIALS